MFIGTPCSLKYDYMSKFKIGKSNILDLRISTAGKHVQELSEWNTFKTRKATASSTLLTRYRFQGYRCKSGIAIFAWRVTWNYAYSPFNKTRVQCIRISWIRQRVNLESLNRMVMTSNFSISFHPINFRLNSSLFPSSKLTQMEHQLKLCYFA